MKPERKVIEYFLELDKGGDVDTVTREEVELYAGICTLIEIIFPPGPSGLVGVRALQGIHQLIPESNKLWLIGDDITYPHGSPVDLLTGSKTLRVEGYNEDTKHDHTITFRFTVTIPVDDPLVAIQQLLHDRIPDQLPFHIKALPDMLAEIINTKLVLENYVVPILDAMNKRDQDRWRRELVSGTITDLAKW